MSRLYIFTESDRRKGTGKCADYKASAQINWGSVSDSKKAASIEVYWPKGAEKPTVNVTLGDEVKHG